MTLASNSYKAGRPLKGLGTQEEISYLGQASFGG